MTDQEFAAAWRMPPGNPPPKRVRLEHVSPELDHQWHECVQDEWFDVFGARLVTLPSLHEQYL